MSGRCSSDKHCSAASYANSLLFSRRTSALHAGSCSSRSRRQSRRSWSALALTYITWPRLPLVVAWWPIARLAQSAPQHTHRWGCMKPGQLEQLEGKGTTRLFLRLQHVQLQPKRAACLSKRNAGKVGGCKPVLNTSASPPRRRCHTKRRQGRPCSRQLPCASALRLAHLRHPETLRAAVSLQVAAAQLARVLCCFFGGVLQNNEG